MAGNEKGASWVPGTRVGLVQTGGDKIVPRYFARAWSGQGTRVAQCVRMPSIYERLRSDIVTAMKARDSKTALILRTLDAAIQRSSMDLGKPIDDGLVITALRKSVKNLADARAEFEKGGRTDLVANNSAEIAVLENYLPKGLDPAQVDALIAEAIRSTGATSKKEMGKVIAALKVHPDAGSLDFGAVSKLIQARLA